MLKEIKHKEQLIAMILTHNHSRSGLEFFTSNEHTLQMGYMKYPAHHRIVPHVHKPVPRAITYTLEAIFVKSGKVLVDLYTEEKKFVKAVELVKGDVILFTSGGHGFKFIEEGELIEIKQGPYVSQDIDKEKFNPPPP